MTRRRTSSMPTGLVLAALAAIGVVALIAWTVLGGNSQTQPPPVMELPVRQ